MLIIAFLINPGFSCYEHLDRRYFRSACFYAKIPRPFALHIRSHSTRELFAYGFLTHCSVLSGIHYHGDAGQDLLLDARVGRAYAVRRSPAVMKNSPRERQRRCRTEARRRGRRGWGAESEVREKIQKKSWYCRRLLTRIPCTSASVAGKSDGSAALALKSPCRFHGQHFYRGCLLSPCARNERRRTREPNALACAGEGTRKSATGRAGAKKDESEE